jgi:ppGpp synthetase/RelA/SpoT-type nucleotidyltranferase
VQRSLDDSKVEAISADLRFVASFTAALTAATIALRAAGYRTVTQTGHHTKIIESLELTLKADSKLIQKLKVFSNKRNKSIYDVAGVVSDQDLREITKLATELQSQVTVWLRKSHPELLKG